jgi:hypothetical protein
MGRRMIVMAAALAGVLGPVLFVTVRLALTALHFESFVRNESRHPVMAARSQTSPNSAASS